MTQFALVGCGQIARKHIPEIRRWGTLAALCDTDLQQAYTLAAGTSARVYANLDALLEQEAGVEVVVVCSPNGLHAEHAIKSLQARRHVLCEKPLCLSNAAAWSMRDTAHFFRRHLFVVQQQRFAAPVRTLQQLLEAGALGRILSFSVNGIWNRPQAYYPGDWHGSPEQDGGILFTQFSHFLDLALWLLGDLSVVHARQQNNGLRRNFDMADTFVALLQTKSGALGTAHFTINAWGSNKEGSVTLVGEKGTVKIGGPYLDRIEWLDVESPDLLPTGLNMEAEPTEKSLHSYVYTDLNKALTGKPHNLPHIQEALRTIELIEQLNAVAKR